MGPSHPPQQPPRLVPLPLGLETIREEQLVAFLNERFDVADAYAERSQMDPSKIGQPIGDLGWVVTPGSVSYSYAASNGGVSSYFHDPVSLRTYQESAHW